MTELKNVIGYLCRYMNLLFDLDNENTQLAAEYVRLAKFNKTPENMNIVPIFWNLLKQFNDETLQVSKELNIVNDVKLNFAHQNYLSLDFYTLPEDMCSGSRELLLAFSWLISNSDILTKILERKISHSSLNVEFPIHKSAEDVKINNLLKPADSLNYAMWLLGKINNNLKMIREYDKTAIKNMKKIHLATKYDLDIPHLSVNDVFIAQNEDLQEKFLSENRPIFTILEARVKWEECQGIFWKWMDSVLEEKVNDTNGRNMTNIADLEHFLTILKSEVRCLTVSNKQMIKTKPSEERGENFHSGTVNRYILHISKKTNKLTSHAVTEMLHSRDSQCEKLLNAQRQNEINVLKDKINVDTLVMQVNDKLERLLAESNYQTS